MLHRFTAIAPIVLAAGLATAAEAPADMQAYVEQDVMTWAMTPLIVAAINAQNARTAGATQEEIDGWDTEWAAQVGTGTQPLVDSVVTGPVSDFLRSQVDASSGIITEVIVMDSRGLNVAASGPTSDYWQGDEAKYSKTYSVGPGAIFVDEVEFDESSQTYQGQASITITDPATGSAIGAMTIGLNAEMFF
ncbi:hypothetical protein AB1M95_08985 [Sulfitobacter sp. LCG007]